MNAKTSQEVRKHSWTAAGLDDLVPAVIAFVLIAIVGSVGALILNGFTTSSLVTSGSGAANAINYGQTAIGTIMSFLPLLGLVVIAAAIIAVVLYAFSFRGAGRGETY